MMPVVLAAAQRPTETGSWLIASVFLLAAQYITPSIDMQEPPTSSLTTTPAGKRAAIYARTRTSPHLPSTSVTHLRRRRTAMQCNPGRREKGREQARKRKAARLPTPGSWLARFLRPRFPSLGYCTAGSEDKLAREPLFLSLRFPVCGRRWVGTLRFDGKPWTRLALRIRQCFLVNWDPFFFFFFLLISV
ncbi:hypothetical protein B0H67DRAFT_185653 [Lasiosphaeris hirsuta]|uniref:Uncharacterized protein n=1 Tax=Lasiosphaeris hirsuta TaxID=260670 RepID=A0AA40AQX8_9PEZI|nr:hypothetical protein B0H67DRAFT_185653 [Lasiosphaeris hirsuta]